jgi:hypothetical protein
MIISVKKCLLKRVTWINETDLKFMSPTYGHALDIQEENALLLFMEITLEVSRILRKNRRQEKFSLRRNLDTPIEEIFFDHFTVEPPTDISLKKHLSLLQNTDRKGSNLPGFSR